MILRISTTETEGTLTQRILWLSFASLHLCGLALIFSVPIVAQRVAIIVPDKSDVSRNFAEKVERELAERVFLVDDAMSEAAFSAGKPETPFNMTAAASKGIGAAIGCDFFILVRSETLRRSSSKQSDYYESYATVYAVSSRTGRLIFWDLPRFEASKSTDSEKPLNDSIGPLASRIVDRLRAIMKSELAEPLGTQIEEPPDGGSPAAKNFRAPVPYLRIKPEYTPEAFLYGIEATVEIVVALDVRGSILKPEIVRWAGYGLDESVEKTVRAMNWRPAERNGRPLAMRFLLRYNFKKIEKE